MLHQELQAWLAAEPKGETQVCLRVAYRLLCRVTHIDSFRFAEHRPSTQRGIAAGHSGQPCFTFRGEQTIPIYGTRHEGKIR